jgi:hypothetical protein
MKGILSHFGRTAQRLEGYCTAVRSRRYSRNSPFLYNTTEHLRHLGGPKGLKEHGIELSGRCSLCASFSPYS